MKYFVNGEQISKEKAEQINDMNNLYLYQAEKGDFAALNKITFIVEIKCWQIVLKGVI